MTLEFKNSLDLVDPVLNTIVNVNVEAYTDLAILDLWQLVEYDPGFTASMPGGIHSDIVVINASPNSGSGAIKNRIKELIGHPKHIYISGGTPLMRIHNPPPVGKFIDLAIERGETWLDILDVRVAYDVTQCNYKGFYVYDIKGDKITCPGPMILYPELSHALHYANGDIYMNQDENLQKKVRESNANEDENVLRKYFNQPLRVTDINDPNLHDGDCRQSKEQLIYGYEIADSRKKGGCLIATA